MKTFPLRIRDHTDEQLKGLVHKTPILVLFQLTIPGIAFGFGKHWIKSFEGWLGCISAVLLMIVLALSVLARRELEFRRIVSAGIRNLALTILSRN